MDRAAISQSAATLQSLANVVLSNDGGLLLEVRVTAGVIGMIVGIDDKAHRLVSDAFQRRLDFVGQGSVLVVDDYDAVVADRSSDVSAGTLDHIDVAGNLCDLHRDFTEVLVLSGGQDGGKKAGGKKDVSPA